MASARQRLDLASIPPNQLNQHFAKLLFGLHATLAFKLRRMRPAPVAVFQVSSGRGRVNEQARVGVGVGA